MNKIRLPIITFCMAVFAALLCFSGCGMIFNGSNHKASIELAKAMGLADSVTIDSVTSSGVTYSFSGLSDRTYTVYWTGDVYVSAYSYPYRRSYADYYFSNEDESGQKIETDSHRTVYITVKPKNYSASDITLTVFGDDGSGITLSKESSSSSSSSSSSETKSWTTGTINSSSGYITYRFSASSGTTYNIYLDDAYSGSGTYTLDAKISAGSTSTATSYFSNEDSCYTTPKTVTPSSYSYVYIKVQPWSSGTGTFAVAVTNSSTGNAVSLSVYDDSSSGSSSSSDTSTTTSEWTIGSITSSSGYNIYRFYASSYTTYNIYLDDSFQGSDSYTLDAKISAGTYSDYSAYFSDVDSCYTTPKTVTPSSSGDVYIKVQPYSSYSSGTGTFAIRVTDASGNNVALSLYY